MLTASSKSGRANGIQIIIPMPHKSAAAIYNSMHTSHNSQASDHSHRNRLIVRSFGGLKSLAGVLVLSTLALTAQAQDRSRYATEAQINAAITRAQRELLKRSIAEPNGPAALAVLALLKSGVDPKTSEINRVCEKLAAQASGSIYTPGIHHVYEAGVTLLALANADAKKYRPQIGVIAQYLITSQRQNGQWAYPNSEDGDTSISQYAILGLWEASRSGVVVPSEVWDKAANWHLRTQQKDGGFAYHPAMGGGSQSLHSMTAAGLGSLRIARRHLFPNARERVVIESPQAKVARKNRSGKRFGILEPVFREDVEEGGDGEQHRTELLNSRYVPQVKLAQLDDGVDKSISWLTSRFTVDKPTGYPIYFLYGLERASSLAEIKEYGTHDWYLEGSTHLVSTQLQSDTWNDTSGETPATAFAVLFMVRATAKMIEHEVPRVEFGSGILVGGRGLPDDLKASELADGKVKKDKKTPLEELLAQLENPQVPLLESTQAEIVEQVVIGERAKLIGQIDRLKRLAKHPDAEVRRTAMWALGRSDDLRLAPILIHGLKDTDIDVFVEARNALRCLSRQVEDFGLKEGPLDQASRQKEWQKWTDWYKTIRAYEERDDSITSGD